MGTEESEARYTRFALRIFLVALLLIIGMVALKDYLDGDQDDARVYRVMQVTAVE